MGKSKAPKITVVSGSGSRSLVHLSRKKLALGLLVIVLVAAVAGGGYWGWQYYQNRKNGVINDRTYPWSKTSKGSVQDQTKNMNNQQKADFFYKVAFEYKNTGKTDDATAAIKVSLQYQRSEKSLLLAAGLAEGRRDFAAAIGYYQEVMKLYNAKDTGEARFRAQQYQKRIDQLREAQKKPAPPTPTKDPSKVSA